jgi:16S rRNA (uracil1498-N3)-methyltransferase
MRKHRFFINDNLIINNSVNLDNDISHQISRVLRLHVGDSIYLFNNTHGEFIAIIESITKKDVTVRITSQNSDLNIAPLKIHLGQVLSKGEKMDLVIQKATELGVHSITPLYSERSLIKLTADRSNTKHEHWQKIAIAACCQSWRNDVPIIYPAQSLFDWINNNTDPHKLILLPHHGVQKITNLKIANAVSILVGPEGGFSEPEADYALQNNFKVISLGPRILRTETAGIAAIAILQANFGDL